MSQIIKEKFDHLKIECEAEICYLTLMRRDGRDKNELNPEFMAEIERAHKILALDSSIQGVIMQSDFPQYFSNGLDPNYMLAQDKKGRLAAFHVFFSLVHTLYSFPKIHFSILEGHTMAGGAFLAICSDYRYMIKGKGRFSFPEALLGLPFPLPLFQIIKDVVQPNFHRQIALEGKAFKADDAKEVGLVDYLIEPEMIRSKATKDMKRTLKYYSQKSLIEIKKTLRKRTIEEFEKFVEADSNHLGDFLVAQVFVDAMKRFV